MKRPDPDQPIGVCTMRDLMDELKARSTCCVIGVIAESQDGPDKPQECVQTHVGSWAACIGLCEGLKHDLLKLWTSPENTRSNDWRGDGEEEEEDDD